MYIQKDEHDCVVKLDHNEKIRLFVPASKGRDWIYLKVVPSGKLQIMSGASVIEAIIGQGMVEKIKHN